MCVKPRSMQFGMQYVFNKCYLLLLPLLLLSQSQISDLSSVWGAAKVYRMVLWGCGSTNGIFRALSLNQRQKLAETSIYFIFSNVQVSPKSQGLKISNTTQTSLNKKKKEMCRLRWLGRVWGQNEGKSRGNQRFGAQPWNSWYSLCSRVHWTQRIQQ